MLATYSKVLRMLSMAQQSNLLNGPGALSPAISGLRSSLLAGMSIILLLPRALRAHTSSSSKRAISRVQRSHVLSPPETSPSLLAVLSTSRKS
ncbi:hypothetical protein BC827DRAFT_1220908 [Russula dissimulans]|nr:hypothetical protein BC827DRAFT_1220908 [Russula dissimulans]